MDEELERRRRLRRARIHNKYTSARAAADAFGWPYETYKKHETESTVPKEYRKIKPDSAERYAKAYKVDAAWILYNRNPPAWIEGGTDEQPASNFRRVPLFSWEQAVQLPQEYNKLCKNSAETTLDDAPDIGPRSFSIEVDDDSMVARPPGEDTFRSGDVVVFDADLLPYAGAFVCAHVEGEGRTLFRKYRPRGRSVEDVVFDLVPLNTEDYGSETFGPGHKSARIVGVLIRYVKKYPRKNA